MFLLPQHPCLPTGSLRRAATYPGAPESRTAADIGEAFTAVGLAHLIDRLDEEGPWDQTLSGGEKQRLAFARILLHNPDIVILDEATSALDPELVKGILALIADLGADGMTMLVVTHEMGFARSTSDTVVFMDHGQVVETGPPDQLFEAAETERLQRFLSQVL